MPWLASDAVQEQRLTTCMACEHLMGFVCTKCGCITNLKVKFAKSECPEGKWLIDEVKNEN